MGRIKWLTYIMEKSLDVAASHIEREGLMKRDGGGEDDKVK